MILHKPFGALAIVTLMTSSGAAKSRGWVNVVFACVTPMAALLFFVGEGGSAGAHGEWIGSALGFCAGTFLCIAGSDLLPELQFHRHHRFALSLALLIGLAVAIAITRHAHSNPSVLDRLTLQTPALDFICNLAAPRGSILKKP